MRAWMRIRMRGAGGRGDDSVVDGGRTGADDREDGGESGVQVLVGKGTAGATGVDPRVAVQDKCVCAGYSVHCRSTIIIIQLYRN